MKNINYEEISNSELKIKIHEMKNEFESYKNSITQIMKKMNDLSIEYNKCNDVLMKRTGGIF
jgi:uncharacterized coiled-coil DUF342 family protein